MAEAPARVWLRQAISDWNTSKRAGNPADDTTYCQIIGKQQQAVEKAVKAVLAALRARKFLGAPTPRGHAVESEVHYIIRAIRLLPHSNKTADLRQHVENLFSGKNTLEINALCALAPKWPGPGFLFPRNTEYPFEISAGNWLAPCDVAIFTLTDLRKFTNLVDKVISGASKVVAAAEK